MSDERKNTMPKYQKKQVAFEAVQLDYSDRVKTREALEFMGATPGQFDIPLVAGKACWWRQTFPNGPDKPPVFTLIMLTENGVVEAADGDWIIKRDGGIFEVCAREHFEQKYEPAP